MNLSVSKYVIEKNIETEKLIKSGKICCACGLEFSDKIKSSKKDKTLCEQYQKDIDF